ncbi:uncharacterized protein LOC130738291 [Lotus japonicus]|uniref:uncharacterized protein LOC130738291 n=1 Tax=Lotus japonicus TaxID=34305 RepID=UPI00258EF184|nr:uncharacterized protein LOC130738291 [Lotus japonicus]
MARNYTVQVADVHFQAVTVSIGVDNRAWLCSVVYASPTPSLREALWSHLTNFRQHALSPWLAVGDFNEIALPTEVLGGDFSEARAARFLAMVEACEFMDLGAIGPTFTWERRLNGRRTIAKRLDRALGDISWRHNFPEAYVENLARFILITALYWFVATQRWRITQVAPSASMQRGQRILLLGL